MCKCIYCNKEFKNNGAKAMHEKTCINNPNRIEYAVFMDLETMEAVNICYENYSKFCKNRNIIYFDDESEYMYYFYAKDGKLYLTRNSIKDIDISCKLNIEKMNCKFNENSNYNILVESNFDKNNLVSVEKYNEQDNTIVIITKSHYYTINLFTHDVAKELSNN